MLPFFGTVVSFGLLIVFLKNETGVVIQKEVET